MVCLWAPPGENGARVSAGASRVTVPCDAVTPVRRAGRLQGFQRKMDAPLVSLAFCGSEEAVRGGLGYRHPERRAQTAAAQHAQTYPAVLCCSVRLHTTRRQTALTICYAGSSHTTATVLDKLGWHGLIYQTSTC